MISRVSGGNSSAKVNKRLSRSVLCLLGLVVWLICSVPPAGAANPLLHNSDTTGSSKWVAEGGWGIAGGQYGEFNCSTCHKRGSVNIKRIKQDIAADPVSGDSFPIQTGGGQIVFNSTIGAESFGDDSGGHPTSDKICEGCHSENKYHNYNTAFNTDNSHENQKDCIVCHKHNKGFGASCDSCHGNPPVTIDTDGSTTTGLVHEPSPTGAITSATDPGAHQTHAVDEGMSCTACHKGNTMPTVSMTVQMGFEATPGNWSQLVGSAVGGNIDAPQNSAMLNGYEFVSSDGGTTTITKVANHDLNCTVYCHGDWTGSGGSNTTPSWVGGNSQAACGTCHGASPGNPPTAGSHTRHAGTGTGQYNLSCTRCHPTVADETHLNASVSWELDTSYDRFGASATYNGASSGSTGRVAPSASYNECDNVYCHSSGQGIADPTADPVYQTPTWGDSFGVTCADACHNVGYAHNSKEAAGYSPLVSGSHGKHLQYHFDQSGSCEACHYDASYTACGDCHNRYGHVDHNISVAFDPAYPTAVTSSSGAYSGLPVPGDAYGDCSNLYCHSQGTAVDSPYAAPNTSSYSWGGSLPIDCTGCHSGDTSAAQAISTASHDEHLGKNIDCSRCHTFTVDDSRTLNTTTRTGDQTNGYYYHSNGWVNVAFDSFSDPDSASTATYDGVPATTQHVPGSAYGDCDNIYCHSSAQGISDPTDPPLYNTPTWGGTIASRCKGCHNGGAHLPLDPVADPPMSSGSHSKHVEYVFSGSAVSCQACHWLEEALLCTPCHVPHATDTLFVRLDKHVDGVIDVDFNPAAGGASAAYTGDGVPQTAYGSCENTYCHSDGNGGAGNEVPTWGTPLAGISTCSSCHDQRPETYEHTKHLNSATYNYNCDECHSVTTSGTSIIDKSVHVNVTKDVDWGTKNADGTAYVDKDTECANIYCHSNGQAGSEPYTGNNVSSVVWDTTWTTKCMSCHYATLDPAASNKIDSNAHERHGATTVGQVTTCTACHIATGGNGFISDYENHVNKLINIKFGYVRVEDSDNPTYKSIATTTVNGATITPGTAVGSCENVYCHSVGNLTAAGALSPFDATDGFKAVAWDTTGLDCADCHGDGDTKAYPVYTNGGVAADTANSHVAHVEDAGILCSTCHGQTTKSGANAPGSMTLVNVSGEHLNRTENVSFNSTVLSGAPSYDGAFSGGSNSKVCSNVDCHFNNDVTWGDSLGCGDCHASITTHIDADGGGGDFDGDCQDCHLSHADGSTDNNDIEISTVTTGTTAVPTMTTSDGSTALYPKHGYKIRLGGNATAGKKVSGLSISFDGPTSEIRGSNIGSGTFPAAFRVGDIIQVKGSTSNGTDTTPEYFTITSIATGALTVLEGITTEAASSSEVVSSTATESQFCWNCHNGLTTQVSEWGINNNSDTGDLSYNYGSVTSSNWSSATWSSGKSDFSYKTGSIQSTHAANYGGTYTAAISSGNDLGFNRTETNDSVENIRCTYCHDVHGTHDGINGDVADLDADGPYLRGSWKGNPYPEDGAPRSGWANWSREGTTADYGLVPRGSASRSNTGKTGVANLGGYWIDQNTDNPNDGETAASTAGLCAQCHSLDDIDQETGEELWVSGTTLNGHNNVVLGGAGRGDDDSEESYDRNIFTRTRRGSAVRSAATTSYNDYVDMGLGTYSSGWGVSYRGNNIQQRVSFRYFPRIGSSTTTGVGTQKPYAYGYFAWNNVYNTKGSATHWRSSGTMDLNVGNITTKSSTSNTETADYDAQANYHTFNCGKCHNPHASRLPKLMITNCLDTNHNDWDNDYLAATSTSVDTVWRNSRLSQWPSAQNCHRLDSRASFDDTNTNQSTDRGTGWNKATPWLETTSPD